MTARSNGLRASAYAVLLEIEESLGDPMLAALAARDIAAYVEPVPGPGGSTRLALYVDVLQRAPAGVVLAGLTPAMAGDPPADGEPPQAAPAEPPIRRISRDTSGPGDDDRDDGADEAAFAALVEAFHRAPDERTWPDAEDLPSGASPPPGTVGPVGGTALPADTVLPAPPLPPRHPAKKWDPKTDGERRRPPSPPASHGPVDGPGDPADDEGHYIPPPLPRLEPSPFATRWALIGLMIGLALLLVPTLLDLGHRTSLDIAGVLFVLGSGAVLVSRLRDRSPDDPDDGAVV
jgi:hypothetical protein